jgi:poly(3-hydroxybutyrate) depolymerase
MKKLTVISIALILILITGCSALSNPNDFRHDSPSEYYLYLPEGDRFSQGLPVFVGIHGFGGSGRDCWSLWYPYARKEGFVLICPTITDSRGGWYQSEGESKVVAIVNQVYKDHQTDNKVFIAGFSAGAQFAQGYAISYANWVRGVAVLSAGNYYKTTSNTGNIPYLVVIGGKDHPDGVAGAERLVAEREYYGYPVTFLFLPNIGHVMSKEAKEATIALFREVR